MIAIPCVIFAGGKSSRMQTNKAQLPFGGYETLVEYQYRRLLPFFASVSISAKKREDIHFECHVIEDSLATESYAPTAGFVALFEALDAERIFVLSVDTPFVSPSEIARLYADDEMKNDATIARTAGGMHPMCGIYHRSLHVKFQTMAAAGAHRLGAMLQTAQTRFVDFEEEEPFINLNYPHEYEAALQRWEKKIRNGGAAPDLN